MTVGICFKMLLRTHGQTGTLSCLAGEDCAESSTAFAREGSSG